MARAIWRGTISFGMVAIPVKLFTATESKDIAFRQIHEPDNSRIRQVKWCPVDDRKVENDELVRGYEYAKDQYVIVDDEDFEKLPVPSKHTIELTAFVSADDVDPIYYEKTYYLEADEVAAKPYALLLNALEQRNLMAIGKIAIRNKERLCALRLKDGGLVMQTLYFADEIRPPEVENKQVEVSEAELNMAFALIDMLEQPFDPSQYSDAYREALMSVITAKIEGQEVVVPEAPEAPKPAVDLMAALKASVEAAKARKQEVSGEDNGAAKKRSRRKKEAVAAD